MCSCNGNFITIEQTHFILFIFAFNIFTAFSFLLCLSSVLRFWCTAADDRLFDSGAGCFWPFPVVAGLRGLFSPPVKILASTSASLIFLTLLSVSSVSCLGSVGNPSTASLTFCLLEVTLK